MAASAETIAAWDPAAVIAAAKELIHTTNYEKVGDARANVDGVIAQWVQVASDPQVVADAMRRSRAEKAIVQAWTLYAALEIELRQFKQATKVFESAVSCAVAGHDASLWLAYASFCIDRKKFSNARKVFVRALRAVAENDHSELWARFHAFVAEHLDASMTLHALQMQVFPEKNWAAEAPPVVHADPNSVMTTLLSHGGNVEGQNGSVGSVAGVVAPPPPSVDPSLAFVDRNGDDAVVRAIGTEAAANGKRKAVDVSLGSPSKKVKTEAMTHPPASVAPPDGYFSEVPTTLPFTPGCPHLLFDEMDTQRTIENELLEKLSNVLSNNAVFQGVRDLYDNQRQRDRDMLGRWQDLVGMQMKEGSELFARHVDAEKVVTEPRELIDLKAKHLEQRREFVNRCQMSQNQFIEICEMDRVSALKAQQISLENMKIPEMTVTTDQEAIELQRAILCLILEADKLSRQESTKKPVESQRPKKPFFPAKPGPYRPRSDSRDRDFYPRGGGRGGRGGGFSRGGGSFGRNGGFRRQYSDSPPRSGRGQSRRHDGYDSLPSSGSRTYDNASRQSYSPYEGDGERDYPRGPASGRGYRDYASRDRPAQFDRADARQPQSYNRPSSHEVAPAPPRFAEAPPLAQSGPVYASQDPYRGANPHAGTHGGRGPPATRRVEYDRGSHYEGPPTGDRGFSAPHSNRYGSEPAAPAARYGVVGAPVIRYGSEPVAPPNSYGGGLVDPSSRYASEQSGPPPQQFSAPPNSYDYAPQPSSRPYAYDTHTHAVPQQQQQQLPVHYGQPAPVYSQPSPAPVYQQPPPQQHAQPLHYQHQPLLQYEQPQRGYGAQPAYQAPPPQSQHHHHQQPYQTSPPRGGGRGGYDRFRRGGGRGGRYGRR